MTNESPEAPKSKKPLWPRIKQRLAQSVVDTTSIPDKMAIERAVDVVKRSKIRKYLEPDGKYLDIGSGLGHIVEQVVREEDEKNIKYLAVDPTWKPLKRLRKRTKKEFPDKTLFMKAEGDHLPIAGHSMDGVSLFFVMHHVPTENQQQILDETKRVLKEDGMLFLTEDVPENEEEAERNATWDRRLNFEPKDEPHFYKNDEEWRKFFEQNGFDLLEAAYWEDISKKKNEGVIKHRSYILRKRSSVKDIADEKSGQVRNILL